MRTCIPLSQVAVQGDQDDHFVKLNLRATSSSSSNVAEVSERNMTALENDSSSNANCHCHKVYFNYSLKPLLYRELIVV